jgi:hypothetical protein
MPSPRSYVASVVRSEWWERHPRLQASIVIAFGTVICLAGFGGLLADRDLSARGVTTTARVVEVNVGRDPSYDVRFQLPNGDVVTEGTSYAELGSAVGDDIRIEYDPEDPATVAQVGARSWAWILWGGWGLTGLGMLLYSVRMLRRSGRGQSPTLPDCP